MPVVLNVGGGGDVAPLGDLEMTRITFGCHNLVGEKVLQVTSRERPGLKSQLP